MFAFETNKVLLLNDERSDMIQLMKMPMKFEFYKHSGTRCDFILNANWTLKCEINYQR